MINGDKYVGDWKNDMHDGYGDYIWANNNKYSGYWKENKRFGKGTFYRYYYF